MLLGWRRPPARPAGRRRQARADRQLCRGGLAGGEWVWDPSPAPAASRLPCTLSCNPGERQGRCSRKRGGTLPTHQGLASLGAWALQGPVGRGNQGLERAPGILQSSVCVVAIWGHLAIQWGVHRTLLNTCLASPQAKVPKQQVRGSWIGEPVRQPTETGRT